MQISDIIILGEYMEYLLGSIVTFLTMLYWYKKVGSQKPKKLFTKILNTQSQYHTILSFARQAIVDTKLINNITAQSTKHFDKNHVRIFVFADSAYWITNNQLYFADFNNGQVDKETAKKVDTIDMDAVELKKISFIVEKLREGLEKNERGNTGD